MCTRIFPSAQGKSPRTYCKCCKLWKKFSYIYYYFQYLILLVLFVIGFIRFDSNLFNLIFSSLFLNLFFKLHFFLIVLFLIRMIFLILLTFFYSICIGRSIEFLCYVRYWKFLEFLLWLDPTAFLICSYFLTLQIQNNMLLVIKVNYICFVFLFLLNY